MVYVQNQHGNTPLKWDNSGTIAEVGAFNKYTIKIDGSWGLTKRNRRFLRPIRSYKEIISRTAPATRSPATRSPAADETASLQTQAEPRRPAMVAKRNQAATTDSRRQVLPSCRGRCQTSGRAAT